ncbi:hypothetical protein MPSEU_000957500 [Mayamaea pseudoterrestris]|nr:hypothetical protein MPSEU_000957500 [Mayamaea pseudoterrestris]
MQRDDNAAMALSNHIHWECSHGLSTRSMLMALIQIMRQVDPSVTSLEPIVTSLQAHLFSIFTNLGLTGTILEIKLDSFMRDITSVQVVLDHDAITRVDEQGNFSDRFANTLRTDPHISLSTSLAATSILQEYHEARKYSADEALAMEHVRSEIACAVECVALLWCMERLSVRSISYSPLPLSSSMLTDESSRARLYQNMTIVPFSSDGAVVEDVAAILLKTMTRSTGNEPFAMQLLAVAKGTDESLSATLSTSAILGKLPVNKPDDMETSMNMAGQQVQPSQTLATSSQWNADQMVLLESNIDDMTAEHLSFCVERMLHAGAADAWTTPILMKKSRPAVTIHCLCHASHRDELLVEMFRHSTTLGVRVQLIDRAILRRDLLEIETEWTNTSNKGRVRVKVGYLGDEVVSIKPEFDHCRVISAETGVTIQAVAEQAKRKAQQQLDEELEVLVELSEGT